MKNNDMLSNMLKEIGLNDLEANIYITLLRISGVRATRQQVR